MATTRRSGRVVRDLWPTLASGELALIALVLVAIVAVAGGLGYQAHAANRANVETARRAITQYSSVAAWQFARTAQRELQSAADVTIGARVQRAMHAAGHAPGILLTPADLRAASPTSDCNCRTPLVVNRYFRWDLGASDIVADTNWPENDRRRIAARLIADTKDPGPGRRPTTPSHVNVELPTVRWAHAGCDLLFDSDSAGLPRALAVFAVYDNGQRLRSVYGAEIRIAEVKPVFTHALDREALLPIALLARATQDSVIAIDVVVGGRPVFLRGALSAADFFAEDSLGSTTFGATIRVGLAPSTAGRLLIGGLPRSRLPLIGLLLVLAFALFGVALRQMRRTAELSRMRSDFVSSVSHELRTPLSLIRVYTETLIDEDPSEPRQRSRFLGVILKESNRLTRLVENLLRFAELERRNVSVAVAPADLSELLGSTVADFRPLAESNAIQVEDDLEPGIVASVDSAAFRQMLFNLLTNAVKFSPAGGRVMVALHRVADQARITVDDQGPGIPNAHRRRVFERYVRLADVGAGEAAGSGIGLAIVRELANAQRMSVWIDDSPLGGARVVLSIAVSDVSTAEVPSVAAAATAGAPGD